MTITDPRDISGLVAWYSAEAETGYADGAAMTSWTDLSGVGNHATAAGTNKPLWQATTGPSGGAAVRFPVGGGGSASSGGYFTLPNLLASATAGEIMLSIKAEAATVNGLWAFGSLSGSNDGSYYPHSGVVYDSFGIASAQRKSYTPTLAVTSWRRYNVWSAASDWAARLDETTQVTSTTATVAWMTTPTLGRNGAAGVLQDTFQGWLSGVVLFNRKLTTTERADLAAWMTAHPSGGTTAPPATTTDITLAGNLPPIHSDLAFVAFTDTATANGANGRIREGGFIDESVEAVAPLPATLTRAVRVNKALAYPTPILVDGRPT